MAASRIAFDADPRRYEEKGADHVVLGVIEDLEGDSPRAPQTQEVGVAAEDLLTERIAALISDRTQRRAITSGASSRKGSVSGRHLLDGVFNLAIDQVLAATQSSSDSVSRETLALITGGAAALGALIGGCVSGYFTLRGERARQNFAVEAEESKRKYDEEQQRAAASGAVREWQSLLRINRDLLELYRDAGTWWVEPQALLFFPDTPARRLVASLLQREQWDRVAHAEAQLRWLDAIRLQYVRDADAPAPPSLPATLVKQQVLDVVMRDLDAASTALAPHA